MIFVRIDSAAAEEMLEGVSSRMKDLSPVFAGPVDERVTQFLVEQFESEGSAGGTPWAPLTSLTLLLRSRYGAGGSRILYEFGRLFAAATGPESLRRITATEYSRGVDSPIAGIQQTGWISRSIFGHPRRNPVTVPARPIIPNILPQGFVDDVSGIVTRYVAEGQLS